MTPSETIDSPIQIRNRDGKRELWLLKAAIGSMLIAVVGILYVLVGPDILFQVERPYLIPWVIATGLVILAPVAYLKWKGQFSLIHPLVYAGATYFFPMFFVGGWSLVFGLSNYYYLTFVNDPERDFPLTFLYIIVGFGALSVGFLISPGRKIGERLSKRLPSKDLNWTEVFYGSFIFLILGFYAMFVALDLGQIGYQTTGTVIGDFGSLNIYLAIIVPVSSFMLWIVFFRQQGWSVTKALVLVAQIISALFMLFVVGGKSGLIQSFVYLVGAYFLVRRKILFRNWAWLGIGFSAALVFGTLYGTTFRALKGDITRISAASYVELGFDTLTSVGEKGTAEEISDGFYLLAERFEIVSSLAVVVSNYEDLRQYEAGYGIYNNIWEYTWTAFIPRFLWKDKPKIADNSAYNELYFGYAGFGYAITSMGDLLRNFGPFGVPAGMFLLGFVFRIFYAALIEGQPFSVWRSTVYFVVLSKISYESFYGEILPTAIRVAAIVVIQLLIIKLVSRILPFRRS